MILQKKILSANYFPTVLLSAFSTLIISAPMSLASNFPDDKPIPISAVDSGSNLPELRPPLNNANTDAQQVVPSEDELDATPTKYVQDIGPNNPDWPLKGPIIKLKQALNEGLISSPRVSAVRAQLPITKSLYAGATAMPNPQLFRDEGAIAEQIVRLGGVIDFVPPWKIAFRLLAAKQQVKQTKLEILNTLWRFRADVRRAYTELVVAQETYQTLYDLAELSKKLTDVSQKRFQAGDVPELDVLKAQLTNSQVKIELGQGLRRLIRAKQQVNIIIGRNYMQTVAAPRLPTFVPSAGKSELLPDFDKPVAPLKDYLALAYNNRLELRLINQQIKTNQALLRNAIGEIIPDPNVSIGSSRAGNPPSGPKLSGFWFTLNLEIPTYNFQQGEIAKYKATLRQLKLQTQSERNLITAQVSQAYNNMLAARERIREYQEHVLNDSGEVARLARRSYEVGQSDITATLQFQQANVQIRKQYLEAVSDYQEAYTLLEQSVGEPLQ